MNTIELQNKLIRKVLNTNDNDLLNYLNGILSQGSSNDYYKLTEFEKTIISESISEYRDGKTISNDEVFLRTDKWLEE